MFIERGISSPRFFAGFVFFVFGTLVRMLEDTERV